MHYRVRFVSDTSSPRVQRPYWQNGVILDSRCKRWLLARRSCGERLRRDGCHIFSWIVQICTHAVGYQRKTGDISKSNWCYLIIKEVAIRFDIPGLHRHVHAFSEQAHRRNAPGSEPLEKIKGSPWIKRSVAFSLIPSISIVTWYNQEGRRLPLIPQMQPRHQNNQRTLPNYAHFSASATCSDGSWQTLHA